MIDLVSIPGGIFLMGSPDDEPNCGRNEHPQHEVTIAPFLMGRYPVTQKQWKEVASLPKVNIDLKPDPSYFKGDDLPVEQVSWYEAVEFCDRLSKKTGKKYRLPNEAEWEYACRAGTETPFYFGPTVTPDQANYDGNYTYGDGPRGHYRKTTTSVGTFLPNGFVLYDMHGNVWEWCQDTWHGDYKGAPSDGSAWTVFGDIYCRVLRGGSWFNIPGYCRSAYRGRLEPDLQGNNLGFRVVCEGVI